MKLPSTTWITCSTDMHMTPGQERAIERLTRDILEHDGLGRHRHRHEFKVWELAQHSGHRTVYLLTVVGSKGDEGSLAEVFARTRRHIAIGPRGGLCLLNARKGRRARGSRVTWELTD